MTTVRELHERAMQLADQLLDAKLAGDRPRADQLAAEAFAKELAATELAFAKRVSAETRLVLFRSAANLAREAKMWEAGLDLAAKALSAVDLRPNRLELFRIIDTLRTYEHLQLAGVELADRDLQLSISGPEAAPGFARAEEVTERVEHVRRFMLRATMRRQGIAFNAPVSRSTRFQQALTPYLSVARAASYAITVRFGVHEQTEMDLGDKNATPKVSVRDALDDLMEAARAYSDAGASGLTRLIGNEEYARNAATLMRQLSPDDHRISTVGLTVQRAGTIEAVALPPRRSVAPPVPVWMPEHLRKEALPPKEFTVVGRLLEGSAKQAARAWATIVTEDGDSLKVHYDEATFGDVIGSYWKRQVSAVLVRRGARASYLRDIDHAR